MHCVKEAAQHHQHWAPTADFRAFSIAAARRKSETGSTKPPKLSKKIIARNLFLRDKLRLPILEDNFPQAPQGWHTAIGLLVHSHLNHH